MIDGLGAAASGINAQSRRMDALANDVANVNTAGYAPERGGFSEPAGAGSRGGVAYADLGPASTAWRRAWAGARGSCRTRSTCAEGGRGAAGP